MTISPQAYRNTAYILRRGLRSAQPTADTVLPGSLYYVTNEQVLEQSDGTSWNTYSLTLSSISVADNTVLVSLIASMIRRIKFLEDAHGISLSNTDLQDNISDVELIQLYLDTQLLA